MDLPIVDAGDGALKGGGEAAWLFGCLFVFFGVGICGVCVVSALFYILNKISFYYCVFTYNTHKKHSKQKHTIHHHPTPTQILNTHIHLKQKYVPSNPSNRASSSLVALCKRGEAAARGEAALRASGLVAPAVAVECTQLRRDLRTLVWECLVGWWVSVWSKWMCVFN
jgi:hypothetical protein